MHLCCNETDPSGCYHLLQEICRGLQWRFLCDSFNRQVLFGTVSAMLVLSIAWNIFCCVKCCSDKGKCHRRMRQSRSQRQMEDNPIYGNISYMQTSTDLYTEDDIQHFSLSSSSSRDQQRINSNSQSKTQDCYANLTLKPPRLQSGHSSQQTQYSDIVQVEEPLVSDKEDDGNTDGVSVMSDLYASVQTQRTKTIDTADNGEDYANHL